MRKLLNTVFVAELAMFVLVVLGILPRVASLYLAAGLALYVLWTPVEDSTILFVRSIPLFLALPITQSFDNFNTWRILVAIIFIKWLAIKIKSGNLKFKNYSSNFKISSWLLLILLLLACASVIAAEDKISAVKRIIYFLNLSLIGFVVYDLAKKNDFNIRLIKNMAIPVIIATVVGFLQVISTYFVDIYQFMHLWGEVIQCNQFGNQWCNIAVRVGNTWLAYYGDQLSLRVFSLFPDSHSFPVFILLGLPAIFAMSLYKVLEKPTLKQMIHTRAKMFVLWIPAVFLIAILSGTRGIWAASIGVVLLAVIVMMYMKKTKALKEKRGILFYMYYYLAIFFILFAVAYPIFVSPQFLVSKGDWGLLGNRVRSIIDFGETSNAQRIAIWKASWESIKQHPVLGVGIGNFPVVLNQDIKLAKAGSSAHNLYIHIAAEMGIVAGITAIWFLWVIFRKTYTNFISSEDKFLSAYFSASLLFVPWVLIYLLTDAAIFDERAFLMFVTTVSIILAIKNPDKREEDAMA